MPPWATLPRATDDNQTINQAIDESIASHNADAEAHLAVDEAIEVHRTASVVDHPAESVVNDKLQVSARRYVAIVDPADESAFDTLEGALTYSATVGGGDIFLVAGTHLIATTPLYIPVNTSLFGLGMGETFIESSTGTARVLVTEAVGAVDGFEPSFVMQDITVSRDEHAIRLSHEVAYSPMHLDRVEWYGFQESATATIRAGEDETVRHSITNCRFHCVSDAYMIYSANTDVDNCGFLAFEDGAKGVDIGFQSIVRNSIFQSGGPLGSYENHPWLTAHQPSPMIYGNIIIKNTTNPMEVQDNCFFTNNRIFQSSGDNFDIATDNNIVTGNIIDMLGTGSIRLITGANNNIMCNNQVDVAITDSGTGNQVANNVTF